jgi:uncharacterized protein (TIGR03083 family)
MLRQINHPPRTPVLDLAPAMQLTRALAVPARLIGGVGPTQWNLPTPCPRWSVRGLVAHLIHGHQMVAIRVRGSDAPVPEPLIPRQSAGPDKTLAQAYREAADTLVDSLIDPAALLRPIILRPDPPGPSGPAVTAPTDPGGRMVSGLVALHLQIVEALVHGWDLARATGQPVVWPEDLAEQSLAFMIGRLTAYREARAGYTPPKAVGAYAPAIDRLVACLGRDPRR